jgi:hypothetical protein
MKIDWLKVENLIRNSFIGRLSAKELEEIAVYCSAALAEDRFRYVELHDKVIDEEISYVKKGF